MSNKRTPMPSRYPLGFLLAAALTIGTFCTATWLQIAYTWTPLQHYYLRDLLRHEIAVNLNLKGTMHRLLYVQDRRGNFYLASNNDVAEASPAAGKIPLRLSGSARSNGMQALVLDEQSDYKTKEFGEWLQAAVYSGMTPYGFFLLPTVSAITVFIIGLLFLIPVDKRRAWTRKRGRRFRGPELLTPSAFVHRMRADGVGFIDRSQSWFSRFVKKDRTMVRIPKTLEPSGIMICGDPGTGKSAVLFQLLQQIADRGERAIVYDPACEFVTRFYSQDRSDVILNPLDSRSPYWDLAGEITHDAEARTLAASIHPPKSDENQFFTDAAQRTLAHLLRLRPSAAELSSWLCNPWEIDQRVRGSEIAAMLDPQAGPQRAGILGNLAMFGDSLKVLPSKDGSKSSWNSDAWARNGRGWIFITSRPTMREQLRPLISTWLDSLILRLMNEGVARRKTWLILDELASLQHLPQLVTALTENRKSGNPLVVAFQGKSQLETLYGPIAETMLSVPATKLIFRTSEPNASKWASLVLGNVEYEQVRESATSGSSQGTSRNEQTEFVTRPLVMPENIAGLPSFHGYVKLHNLVTELHTCYIDIPSRTEGFIPRIIPPASPDTGVVLPPQPVSPKGGGHGRLIFE